MLTAQENELMTRVGPGTPAGEMLRRYWWPVGFSDQVKAKAAPAKVTLLGEDFVLFRDGAGQLDSWRCTVRTAGRLWNSAGSRTMGFDAAITAGFGMCAATVWSSRRNPLTALSKSG